MSYSYSKETIEELKSQVDIVDVISRSVTLKRAGANYKGLCPFHNEKTPSFIVSPDKQIFTCFGGCGATGDVVGFVKRYYNLEFNDAVEKIAKEQGITLQKNNYDDNREKYYQINREAAMFFYKALTTNKNPGYEYLKKRGIQDQTIKKFGLGFADNEWGSLFEHFKKKGTDPKILLELGLISEKNGKYFDKFRNRVIFPIISTSGKVIGFGGRALTSEMEPKYLNSPENRVFQKKNNLYGLNLTRQDISKAGRGIIVEGYMDAISLWQNGVTNVAASLGTALTENQAKLITRYTKNVVLSYDADEAGQKAALRGIEVLKNEKCKVRVLHVTDGKDPDEYIKKNGKEAFISLVDKALPYMDYKLLKAKKGLNFNKEEDKIDYIKNISVMLRELSPVEREVYVQKVSKDIGISENAIRFEIGDKTDFNVPEIRTSAKKEEVHSLRALEASVIKCLLLEPKLTDKMLPYEGIFESSLSEKVISIIFELYGLNGDFDISQVLDRLEPTESEELEEGLNKVIISGNENDVLEENIRKWEFENLERQEKELIDMLSLADESANQETVRELTLRLMEVQKEKKSYRSKG